MILIRTNKEIGEFLEKSRIDNTPIRRVQNEIELEQYTEGVDYELLNDMHQSVENTKNSILDTFLNMGFHELAPSRAFKSELHILNDDEFDKLRKHMNISDEGINEYGYDTIIISNIIFKRNNNE